MSGSYDRGKDQFKLNPVVSYNFSLEVEAMFFMPLRSVRVFTKENEFEYYQEGGLNDYVHMLRKPISKPFTFQVERYIGMSENNWAQTSFFDPIALGTDLILPVVLYVSHSPAGNDGANFNPKNTPRAYVFTGCTVTAKEYGELNAERSGLATETTTIAYKEVFVFNQLSTSWQPGDKLDIDNLVKNKSGKYKPQDKVRWSDSDTTVAPVLWDIDKATKPYKPNDQVKWSSTDTTADPILWNIDKATKPYKPNDQVKWSKNDTLAAPSKIDLDSVAKSGVRPYAPQERVKWSDKDTKAEPSIWPPTRRALMANELAK